MGGWGQKMAIIDELQYCKSSKIWLGGQKHDDVILEWSLSNAMIKQWVNEWVTPRYHESRSIDLILSI